MKVACCYSSLSSASFGPYLGFAATDGPGSDGARLLVPAKDFGHAAMGDPELSGDDARPDAVVGHLHDFMTDVVGQRSAIYENSSELVHSALTQRSRNYLIKIWEELVTTKVIHGKLLHNTTTGFNWHPINYDI